MYIALINLPFFNILLLLRKNIFLFISTVILCLGFKIKSSSSTVSSPDGACLSRICSLYLCSPLDFDSSRLLCNYKYEISTVSRIQVIRHIEYEHILQRRQK